MSPGEFNEYVRGYQWREEQAHELAMQRTAWLAVHVLAPWTKKPPTVAELLGRKPSGLVGERPATAEGRRAKLAAQKRAAGITGDG